MALNESDVELIRAAWVPARRDSVGAGVLLFKGLFTKFPDYLRLFNQFDELDAERLQENKRLVKHAVKVIETVTFVVDSIGDPAKGDQLNEALVALVRGHLKRKIGLKEFRNLGIVLIDFICDLNNRRSTQTATAAAAAAAAAATTTATATTTTTKTTTTPTATTTTTTTATTTNCAGAPALARAATNSSTSSSQDSETMTSALDKIRTSTSPSSCSSEDESLLLARATLAAESCQAPATRSQAAEGAELRPAASHDHGHNYDDHDHDHGDHEDYAKECERPVAKLDTSALVAAWTKLYGVVLDLVASEEAQASQ